MEGAACSALIVNVYGTLVFEYVHVPMTIV